MRIAISGHRDLHGTTAKLITAGLDSTITELTSGSTELVGVTCLADGADQMFAEAILRHGGNIEVVIPAEAYRDGLPDESRPTYDELLAKATAVRHLEHLESTSESHMDASIAMLDGADHLIAVWDGQPARGFGGTADVVAHAEQNNIPVSVVWPDGAVRGT